MSGPALHRHRGSEKLSAADGRFYQWNDLYDITIVPIITDEDGINLAKNFAED